MIVFSRLSSFMALPMHTFESIHLAVSESSKSQFYDNRSVLSSPKYTHKYRTQIYTHTHKYKHWICSVLSNHPEPTETYLSSQREQGEEGNCTLVLGGSTAPNLLEPPQIASLLKKEGV